MPFEGADPKLSASEEQQAGVARMAARFPRDAEVDGSRAGADPKLSAAAAPGGDTAAETVAQVTAGDGSPADRERSAPATD